MIADFYHHPSKVVIEIDGSIHDLADVQVRDRRRTELLEQRGFVVVRYTNDDVIYNLDMVMTELQQRIGERLEQKNAWTMDTND